MDSKPDAEGRLSRLILAYDEALLAGHAYDTEEELGLSPELRQELAAVKDCLRLLRQPAIANAPTVDGRHDPTPPVESTSETEPELPRNIGRFQILDRLGAGGGGMVFLAFDPKLRRKVALKTPPPEYLLSAALRQRFQREAEATALLNHPHVVAVHEVGEAGPIGFIAAEYCEGGSLDDWLRTRTAPVPIDQAVSILLALAEGVQHAHSRGVLHRDIKPGNVLFAQAPRAASAGDAEPELIPKLGDFGLARILASDEGRTRTGTVLGTYAYMAPEQAQGRTVDIDVRADVYALGVVLYELLTGRPPLKGSTDAETIHRVVYDDPAPPRRWRPDTPRDLEAICLKCLGKSPSGRYATADALAEDLRRFQRREPTVARPLAPPQRLARLAQRRPAWAALTIVSLAAVIALVSTVLVYNAHLRSALHRTSLYAYASLVRSASDAGRQDDVQGQRNALDLASGIGTEDLRTFPYRLLAREAWGDQVDLGRNPKRAYTLAIDAKGRWIASAGEDGAIRLWATDGQQSAVLSDAHRGEINAIAAAPEVPLFATAGADGAVRIWDVDRRQLLRELGRWPGHAANCVAFSPDGAQVAAGFDDGVARFWNRRTWELVYETPPRASDVRDIVFSPDAKQAVLVDKQEITLWDVAQRAELWKPHLHDEPDPAGYRTGVACFSHDGRILVTVGRRDRVARIWNVRAAKESLQIPLGEGWIHAASFSPDDRWLALAGKRKVIWLYDWRTGELVATLRGHTDCVRSLTFDRGALYSTGDDGLLKRWDYLAALNRMRTHHLPWSCGELVVCESGEMIGLSTQHGLTLAWNTRDGQPKWTFGTRDPATPDAYVPQPLATTSDGRLWASLLREGDKHRIVLLSGADGRIVSEIESPGAPVASLAISPDGSVLLIGTPERVHVWDVAARSVREKWPYALAEISSLQFAPGDPSRVLVGVNQVQSDPGRKFAELRSLSTGALRRYDVDRTERRALAFSHDGARLAGIQRDSIVVWNLADGGIETALRGPECAAGALAFAHDGTLASYSFATKTVCFWDLRMAEPLHTIPVIGALDLAFLPGGRSLVMTVPGHRTPGAVTVFSAAGSGAEDDPQPDTDGLRTTQEIEALARLQRAEEAMEHAHRAGFSAGMPSYPEGVGAAPCDLLLGAGEESQYVVDYAIPMALVPDEKTLVEKMGALARYSHDHGFAGAIPWIGDSFVQRGRSGYALCRFSLQDDEAIDVERLADGSLIAAGSSGGKCRVRGATGLVDLAIAKLTPRGDPDSTFGHAGRVQLDLGGYLENTSGVEIVGDRIVLAGISRPDPSLDDVFVLAALTPDGKLDARFGNEGVVRTGFRNAASALCNDLAQDDQGRLIAAGETRMGPKGPLHFALARYLADGSLDPEFGDGAWGTGRVAADFGLSASINDIELDHRQRILATGFVDRNPRNAPATTRFLDRGGVDDAFRPGGADATRLWVQPILPGMSAAQCVAPLPDGRFLLAGSASPPGSLDSQCFLARCLENGELDPSFAVRDEPPDVDVHGPPGVALVPLGRPNSFIRDIVVLPDGRIVALANVQQPPRLALLRFLPDGQLDSSFGSEASPLPGAIVPRLGLASQGSALKFDTDGSLLVAGRIQEAERGYEFMVARFTSEGELDRAFGDPIEGLAVKMFTGEAAERTDIPLDELGNPSTIEDRYRAVDQWAVRHGYLGGYPNWVDGITDGRHVVGAELIRPGAGEVRPAKQGP